MTPQCILLPIRIAMDNPDEHAVEIQYRDKWGDVTTRTVSPIRWIDTKQKAFLALCTGREEPRRFESGRVLFAKLVPANEVLMPAQVKNG